MSINKSKKEKNKRLTNNNNEGNKKYNKKDKRKNNNVGENGKKLKFSKRHPKLTIFIRLMLLLIVTLIVAGVGIVCGMIYGGWGDDFEITKEDLVIGSSNSIILDKDGNKLAELSGDDNRKIIKFDEMPKNLINAYVSIEDERFYEHHGIDLKRTGGAIFKYIIKKGDASFGGSTITQQLVKNVTQDKERSGMAGIMRKVKEWAKAYQIERMISKDQILELYLNIIYVGGGKNNLGVEVGAEYYFNKKAADLNLAECAFLAGINHKPGSYDPYKEEGKEARLEAGKKRTKTVLKKMLDLKKITQEEYDEAVKQVDEGLNFEKSTALGTMYSYHTDATISQVIEDIAKEKEISKSLATTYVYSSGLTIYSTQDTALQEEMNSVMVDNSDSYIRNSKKVEGATSQAAMAVIDNETGYVVGVVGGLGEKTESRGLNRATQSPRQTGSSIKPLTSLVPGINEGYITASTIYDDTKASFNSAPGWDPKDYNTPRGLISVREGIRTSQNLPFIKVVAELTPAKSTEYLEKMGVSTINHEQDGLAALSIGGFTTGISPLEMAGCYATIANDGVYKRPMFYSKVTDSTGKVVLEGKQTTEQVISPQAAYVIKNILQTVVKSGTATYCGISGMDVAAKTGTTNSNYDKWLCGFTNYYSAACWYGFDQNEEVTGSTNVAGQIWAAVMKKIHSGMDSSRFERPEGIVDVKICRASGKKATDMCTDTYSEIFVEGMVPGECDAHSNSAEVCEDTGLLANEYCPNKVTQYFSYVVEKERLGLWQNHNSSVSEPPTTYCEEHSRDTAFANSVPKITLNGDTTINLKVNDKYEEKGATAKDDKDGDISNKISISGTVNTSKAGTYTITYKVKNSLGKETSTTRTIIVKGNEKEKEKENEKEKEKPEEPAENTTPASNTTPENTTPAENKTTETENTESE